MGEVADEGPGSEERTDGGPDLEEGRGSATTNPNEVETTVSAPEDCAGSDEEQDAFFECSSMIVIV